jgi:hypothetical protein
MEETVWLGDIPVATLQPSGTSVAISYTHQPSEHTDEDHALQRQWA